MQMTTFDATKQSLIEVLGEAAIGKLQLPDFQRGWVWDDEHIRDLLASVSRAFPIGAVMLLEAGGREVRFKTRPIEGVSEARMQAERLILDGQQRLTSLFQSLMSGKPVETRDAKGKPLKRWYYIDMKAALDPNTDRIDAIVGVPEDKVIRGSFGREIELDLSTPEKEYENEFFPISQIANPKAWRLGYHQYWGFEQEKVQRFDRFEDEVLDAFTHFQVPVIALKKEVPKEAVCLVFEKVNTGGVSLTVFELLTATYAADNFELRKDWEERRRRIHRERVLSEVASTDFLQAVTLVSTYEQRRSQEAEGLPNPSVVSCKRRDILKLSCAEYQRWADPVEEGFRRAARFLHRERVFDSKFLPYNTQLIPLAALLTVLGKRADDQGVHDKLVRWYWCGVFGELYGSATETRFARDLPEVLDWIDGGPEPRTVEDANFAPERLLTLQTRRSAAYRGIYVMLLREGAKDFRTGEESSLQTYFDESIDIHHIFPRKWCADHGIEDRLCNSIVNKTPLTARTNRIVGGRAPSDYLSSLERNHGVAPHRLDENLRSHLIEPQHIRNDDFESFFEARSKALLDVIQKAMGKTLERDPTEDWVVDPDEAEDDIE
ncbi:MAG: hypothetical protein KatS3mg011_1888 [Acidimicrobiia bacterium]|nr:MAG: hypothetical protein KatS3mg011_1888 [Acidimicrobiia bacterium]